MDNQQSRVHKRRRKTIIMKIALLALLAFVPTTTADCRKEWWTCTNDHDDYLCCDGYECKDIGEKYSRCVPAEDNINQCCLPNKGPNCEQGDCCPGHYCHEVKKGWLSECRPGPDKLGLYNGLCEADVEIDTEFWKTAPVPLYGRCKEAGGQSNCLAGYKCEHAKNKLQYPPKCYRDPAVETECCWKMGSTGCKEGECCPGSYCYEGDGFTQCRAGVEKSGKNDGRCDPPNADNCKKFLYGCRRYAGIDDCCDGYTCEEANDGRVRCIPEFEARNDCCLQTYMFGCNTGDCCDGLYCAYPSTKKSQCKHGVEEDLSSNGLCEPDHEIRADAFKDVCAVPWSRCDLGGEEVGSQGDCCEGFVCEQNSRMKYYHTCQPDKSIDTTCCLPYYSHRCTPGDCCAGLKCVQLDWTSRCLPGEEPTGRKDGLCSEDETLLYCAGSVGRVWGDPHFITFDEFKYDCQGRGEFIVVRSEDTYFEVQGRQQALPDMPEVSSTSAFAVSVTKDRSIPTVEVTYAADLTDDPKTFDFNKCPAQLWVGGVLQDINNIPTFPGVTVTYTKWSVQVQFGPEHHYAAAEIRSTGHAEHKYGCILDINVCLPSGDPGFTSNVVGLIGTPNKDKTDDWMSSQDGSIIPTSTKSSDGYDYCTKNWCNRDPKKSLFSYGKGDSHADYMDCGEGYPGDIVIDVTEEEADRCNGDKFCLEEGTVGGDEGVDAAVRVTDQTDQIKRKPVIGNAPPQETDAPTEEPEDTPVCADDIKIIGLAGESEFGRFPLQIVSQDTTSVTVKLSNPFLDNDRIVNHIFHQYQSGGDKCDCDSEVDPTFSTTFKVDCWESKPISIVRVWVADGDQVFEEDEANIAECCHVEEDMALPVVEWVFEVSCVPMCDV